MRIIDALKAGFGFECEKPEKVKFESGLKKENGININGLVVYTPKNITDINQVIDAVAKVQAVIINFSAIKKSERLRINDYLLGALYVLNAEIVCLQNELYVVMPKGANLTTI